jgi:peptidoglycan hydrolase-like protein with peptidoglycan-binding domain
MGKGPEVTTDGVIMAGLNGTFFDAAKPEVSPLTPATYALRNPTGKSLQSYLTDYTINTALTSGFETGNTLDITYLLLTYLNVTVTTDNLGVVVPQILTKYGSGKAVSISGAFVKAASVAKFSAGGAAVNGNLAVTIKVGEEVAIQAEFDSIALDSLLTSTSGVIFGHVSKNSLGSISNFQSSLGMTADQLLAELQGEVDTVFTQLNANLTAGITIPTIFGINVSDVELNISEGLAEFGINATPEFFLAAQQTYRFLTEEAQRIRNGEFSIVAYEPIVQNTLFLQ